MTKFWKHAGIGSRISFISICFLSFCVCCEVLLLGLKVCHELCAPEALGEK